jgi:hypothetical protein
MKNNKVLLAKVLTVLVIDSVPYNECGDCEEREFEVLEFENDLIMVEGESTNNWFFDDRDSIEGCGCDIVQSVAETGEVREILSANLLSSIQESISEFGVESVSSKHLELWK